MGNLFLPTWPGIPTVLNLLEAWICLNRDAVIVGVEFFTSLYSCRSVKYKLELLTLVSKISKAVFIFLVIMLHMPFGVSQLVSVQQRIIDKKWFNVLVGSEFKACLFPWSSWARIFLTVLNKWKLR